MARITSAFQRLLCSLDQVDDLVSEDGELVIVFAGYGVEEVDVRRAWGGSEFVFEGVPVDVEGDGLVEEGGGLLVLEEAESVGVDVAEHDDWNMVLFFYVERVVVEIGSVVLSGKK